MSKQRNNWAFPLELVAAIALLAVAVFLRFDGLTAYSLSPDEGIDYRIAHDSDVDSAVSGMLCNAHPPLFYAVLRLMAPLGDGLICLRLPSLVFGCLAVAGMYLLGRRIAGPVAGFVPALIFALSPSAIVLSQVVRPYAMQMAFVVFCLFFLISWLRDPRRSYVISYSIMLLLAVSTHYTSIILMGAALAVLTCKALIERPRRIILRDVILAHIPAVLALVVLFIFHLRPYLIEGVLHIEARDGWLKPFFVTTPGEVWRSFLGLFLYLAGTQYGAIFALLSAVGLFVAVAKREYSLAMLSLVALTLAMAFSLAGQLPFGGSRHSFNLFPFLLIPAACLAGGVLSLPRRGQIAAMVAFCLVLGFHGRVNGLLHTGQATVSGQMEQITKVRDYARISSVLEVIADSGGVILCDQQTRCYLAKEINGWASVPYSTGGGDIDLTILSKGNCFVIVLEDAWCMGAQSGNGSAELAGLLKPLADALPHLHLITRDSIWIMQGGWGCPLTESLGRLNDESSASQSFLLDCHRAPGVELLEISPAKYLRAAAP